MNTPFWTPEHPDKSRMYQFMTEYGFKDYPALYQWSIQSPHEFWLAIIHFFKLPIELKDIPKTHSQSLINSPNDFIKRQWFTESKLNFAECLLSGGKDHDLAILSFSEHLKPQTMTYAELKSQVKHYAQYFLSLGLQQGDRVVAVMPNIPETIIAMLATTAIGAIWASCSPDFGESSLMDRLGQLKPSLLIITNGHTYQGKQHINLERIETLSKQLEGLKHTLVVEHLKLDNIQYSHATWNEIQTHHYAKDWNFPKFAFDIPSYILFSSGTTGKPKCIVHGAGGTLLQHVKELGLHTNIKAQDKHLFYTTCGWMMWNWLVSTLSLGATVVQYEGSPGYPTNASLFDLCEKYQINILGCGAKFIATLMHAGYQHPGNLASLKTLLSTGSPLLPEHFDYIQTNIKNNLQVSSISGGSDIISCFALGNPLLPVYRGELQSIGLGMAVDIFDENGHSIQNKSGELVCKAPFPSMPLYFWNDKNNERYLASYFNKFPNIWTHGDFAEITTNHGIIIHGRSDATLNPGGVRIGTAEIYRALETISDIQDSVVIGLNKDGDEHVVLFVKLTPGITLSEILIQTIKQHIKQKTSPRHVPSIIKQVSGIPRTHNGKLVELAVKQKVMGQTVTNLSSIENPELLIDFVNPFSV